MNNLEANKIYEVLLAALSTAPKSEFAKIEDAIDIITEYTTEFLEDRTFE